MTDIQRRRLMVALAQGTALAAFGLPGNANRALARQSSADEWEFYLPGVYSPSDEAILAAFQAKLERVNSYGPVDIADVVSGKLAGAPPLSWNPMEFNYRVTRENMLNHARMYTNDNPLFNDAAYAAASPLGELTAFPLVLTLEAMPAMPKAQGIGDYMVVTGHNDTITFHRPIRADDTLYTIYQAQHCQDITPAAGSHYRTFAMSGWAKTYNQRAELVAEGANILKESFRRHSNPAVRNRDGAHAWESPDWWHQRPAHVYTDDDWRRIRRLWQQEQRRGATPLYWDEVKVGDRPAPTAVGPIISDVATDMMFFVPPISADIRTNVLDPKRFAGLLKNAQGIYLLPEYQQKKPAPARFSGAGADTRLVQTPEIARRDGRATLQNAVCGKCAAGMLYNWMGDAGWLQRIAWDIMPVPPGYDESVIPAIAPAMMPAQFDSFPYLEKVPSMRGRRARWHPLEGDLIISNASVTSKYIRGTDHLVDLTWWSETLDGYLIEEGMATVRLPARS